MSECLLAALVGLAMTTACWVILWRRWMRGLRYEREEIEDLRRLIEKGDKP